MNKHLLSLFFLAFVTTHVFAVPFPKANDKDAVPVQESMSPCHIFFPTLSKRVPEYSFRSASLPTALNIPDSISMPDTRDQGSTNTCWAYSSTSAIEFNRAWNNFLSGEWISYPNDSTFSVKHLIENKGFETPVELGGTMRYSTAYYASGTGPALDNADSTLTRYFTDITFYDALTPDSIKRLVLKHGHVWIPVNGSMLTSPYRDSEHHASYIPSADASGMSLNHAVLIVGWDDNFNQFSNLASKPSSPGAWLVQNSWGTANDSAGYFHLSYYSAMIGCPVTFSGDTVRNDNDTILQKDRLGEIYDLNFNRAFSSTELCDTIFQVSFFPIEQADSVFVSRVGFWVSDDGDERPVTDTIQLYKASSLEQAFAAEPIAVAGAENLSSGYHSLPIKAGLKAGDTLCVMQYTIGTTIIPVEAEADVLYAHVTPQKMQYIYPQGSGYGFLDQYSQGRNLCIKVYAQLKSQESSTTETSAKDSDQTTRSQLLFTNGPAEIYAITRNGVTSKVLKQK